MSTEARTEAQRRYPDDAITPWPGLFRDVFVEGAEWQASRPVTDAELFAAEAAVHRAIAPDWMSLYDALGGDQAKYGAFLSTVATAALEAARTTRQEADRG